MEIVSWPTGVNQVVTSDASISLGEGGVKSDTAENGSEQSYLSGSGAPDRYSVTMYFSNSRSDTFYENHTDSAGRKMTEWAAFKQWFKHTTMMGVNPFYFPDIEDPGGGSAVYRILSSGLPKGAPFGEYVKVTMTWTAVFNEYITIADEVASADTLDAGPGRAELHLAAKPASAPAASDFLNKVELLKDGVSQGKVPVEGIDYDGYRTVVVYFDPARSSVDGSTYKVKVTYGGGTVEDEFIYRAGGDD